MLLIISLPRSIWTFSRPALKSTKPQFGGWCAYAVSLGRVAPIDVNTFSIADGRLVIQHNQRAVNGWNKDVKGNLGLAG